MTEQGQPFFCRGCHAQLGMYNDRGWLVTSTVKIPVAHSAYCTACGYHNQVPYPPDDDDDEQGVLDKCAALW